MKERAIKGLIGCVKKIAIFHKLRGEIEGNCGAFISFKILHSSSLYLFYVSFAIDNEHYV